MVVALGGTWWTSQDREGIEPRHADFQPDAEGSWGL